VEGIKPHQERPGVGARLDLGDDARRDAIILFDLGAAGGRALEPGIAKAARDRGRVV